MFRNSHYITTFYITLRYNRVILSKCNIIWWKVVHWMRERHKIDTVYSHPIPIRKHFSSRCLFYNLALLLLPLLFNLYQFIPSLSLSSLWSGQSISGLDGGQKGLGIVIFIGIYAINIQSLTYCYQPTTIIIWHLQKQYVISHFPNTSPRRPLNHRLWSSSDFLSKLLSPTGHHKIRDDYLIQMLSINKCPRHLETITVQSQTPQHCP